MTTDAGSAVAEKTVPSEAVETKGVMVQMPKVLKDAIDAQAKAKDVSVSRWMREFLAESLGVELPEIIRKARKKKYATPEERAAAQKARVKTQRDVFTQLLARYGEDAGIAPDADIAEFAKALGLISDDGEVEAEEAETEAEVSE